MTYLQIHIYSRYTYKAIQTKTISDIKVLDWIILNYINTSFFTVCRRMVLCFFKMVSIKVISDVQLWELGTQRLHPTIVRNHPYEYSDWRQRIQKPVPRKKIQNMWQSHIPVSFGGSSLLHCFLRIRMTNPTTTRTANAHTMPITIPAILSPAKPTSSVAWMYS